MLKSVLKSLLGPDPGNPDNFRLDPIFSGLKFVYVAMSQVWWVGDYSTGFSKFDQVISAFNEDRSVKIDWESNKYWKNQARVGERMTRDQHIEQARTAIALAIGQIDHRMGVVKEEMVGLAKELDKYGEAVTYKPVEDAIAMGADIAS